MIKESWKIKEGFSKYAISNLGNIKRLERRQTDSIGRTRLYKEMILKPRINKSGYCQYILDGDDGSRFTLLGHRLVAEIFIENPNNFPIVNHLDGIKINNVYTNLEWVTHSGNNQHAKKTGLHAINKPIIQKTLEGEFIEEFYSTRDAQKKTGIDGSCISKVCKGKRKTAGGFNWSYKLDI